MELTSSAFIHNGSIPSKYTCDGDRSLSPPLTISQVPEGAKSLALIMDDPDVPKAKIPSGLLTHWVVYNLPPDTRELPEGAAATLDMSSLGTNGLGTTAYFGPCPPPEYEPSEHRYVFTLYALSGSAALSQPPTKEELLEAIEPLTLSTTQLIGRYKRSGV